ncbi:TonB-dependent receptor domain-containing protein [Acidipila sp. EB88]|uniref:TonB-dependent receptor n=1 Tax=Acidipila sp. EB88 TaxID=2305226 RepID=UPI0021055C47|nr:TonB-dependent receptor [Acidipila sp. EB88]
MPSNPLRIPTKTLLVSAGLLLAATAPLPSFFPAYGQGITTGTISGAVTDSSGAVVPGARVTAVAAATGIKLETISKGDGDFTFTNVPVGVYAITISASGFSDFTAQNAAITSGNTLNLGKATLTTGGSTQEVTVSAATALMDTTQAQVSSTFSTQQLENLPLNNGFDRVALLIPGVVQTHDNSFSNNNGASFSANGQRGRSNNFELDGQANNDNSVGGPQLFFGNQDAIQEIQVISNSFSAQYGRNMGTVVNYITKAGSNAFHGSAFEFYQGSFGQSLENSQKNPLLGYCTPGQNAATDGCAPVVLPRDVENKFGGTIGGPILKDRLFFFGSAYFDRNHFGGGNSVSGTDLTPNPAGLAALSAAFPNNPGVAALTSAGPYAVTTGNPTAYGPVVNETVTLNGTSALIPFQAVERSVASSTNDEEVLGRLDWQPTSKDHLYLRYFYQDDPSITDGTAAQIAAGSWYNVPDTAHSIGADWTHVFSPNWSDQIRYSFQQTSLTFQSGALSNCTINTPGDCTSSIAIQGNLGDGSYSNLTLGYADNIPQGRVVKVNQVQDNATWTAGKHTILFGGEFDKQNSPNGFLPNYNGTYTYGNFGDVINGTSTLNITNGSYTIPFQESDYALYFQDDYKATPSLTLNMGLRWEYFGQAGNLLHSETVARESNPATALWDQTLPLSERTFPSTESNYKNFEPRVGFAYNPDFNRHLVIHGGFAINFDPAFYNMFIDAAEEAPVADAGTINCNGTTVVCQSPSGALGSATRALALPLFPTGANPNQRNQTFFPKDFKNPYAENFNLGVNYQVGRNAMVSALYVGNHSIDQFQALNANPNLLATAQAFPNTIAPSVFCQDTTAVGIGRPNCNQTTVREFANTAFSIYNGLQLQAKLQDFHGFSGFANYTYSRTIDNTSDVFSTFGGGNSETYAPNPFSTDIPERGESGVSVPHVFSAAGTYVLPFYKQNVNSLAGRVFGGYELNGIYEFDSGQPATPYQLYFNQNTDETSYCDSGFQAAFSSSIDSCRPLVSNPSAPVGTVGYYLSPANAPSVGLPVGWYNYITGAPISGPQAVRWLHNDQSDIAAIGSTNPFAGVSRSTLRATHFSDLDVSLFKTTPIRENVSLQLQFTALNVLNQQFYGTPDPEIEDPSFQQTYYNTGTNRTLQFGGKIIF